MDVVIVCALILIAVFKLVPIINNATAIIIMIMITDGTIVINIQPVVIRKYALIIIAFGILVLEVKC